MPDQIPGQLDLEEAIAEVERGAEKNALFVLRYGGKPAAAISRYECYLASGTHLDYPEWASAQPQDPEVTVGTEVSAAPSDPDSAAAVAWLESRPSVPSDPGDHCPDRMACNAPNPCRCNGMRSDRFSAGNGEPLPPTPEQDFQTVLVDLAACCHILINRRSLNTTEADSMRRNLANTKQRVQRLLDNHLQSQ